MLEDYDESEIADKALNESIKSEKSAEARRRIEIMKDIRESGLTIEEAKELGIWP
ncbi:VirK/YbjX family protein [Vibrio sp.]|nr:VirK/YbjX family protein [Vibrio sp.]